MIAPAILVTCEHGGNDIPADFAHLFHDHAALLASHRGFDAGALEYGRALADALGATFIHSTVSRLLVDLNRSPGHRQRFSFITNALPDAERQAILDRYYLPYWDRVRRCVTERIAAGAAVLHLSAHSFTPVLNDVVRRADIGLLYDPRRPLEAAFAARCCAVFRDRHPEYTVRRNYPYQGRSDGLVTALRKQHAHPDYVGLEIEVSQKWPSGNTAAWQAFIAHICGVLRTAIQSASSRAGFRKFY